MPLPNHCTDPAAWGALWNFLTAEGWHVTLETFADRASADVRDWRKDRAASVHDNEKGRALVLATLAAYGVDIKD